MQEEFFSSQQDDGKQKVHHVLCQERKGFSSKTAEGMEDLGEARREAASVPEVKYPTSQLGLN